MKIPLLVELRCNCGEFFLYCRTRGKDFRCDKCRNKMTAKEVEKELAEMDIGEYTEFMEEIAEYEKEHGPVNIEDDDE